MTDKPTIRRRHVVDFWLPGIVVVALIAFSAYGFWVYVDHDHIELVDDPAVVARAEAACAAMTTAVTELSADASYSPAEIVRTIRAQDEAVSAMVADVRRLGTRRLDEDLPAVEWLGDWEQLVRAREAYAAAVTAGSRPSLQVPMVDRRPITHRMNEVGLDCQVPEQLTQLRLP